MDSLEASIDIMSMASLILLVLKNAHESLDIDLEDGHAKGNELVVDVVYDNL